MDSFQTWPLEVFLLEITRAKSNLKPPNTARLNSTRATLFFLNNRYSLWTEVWELLTFPWTKPFPSPDEVDKPRWSWNFVQKTKSVAIIYRNFKSHELDSFICITYLFELRFSFLINFCLIAKKKKYIKKQWSNGFFFLLVLRIWWHNCIMSSLWW